jgi:arylsulfatase
MTLPRPKLALAVLLLATSAITPVHAQSTAPFQGTPANGPALPYPTTPFTGHLAPTEAGSTPYLPTPVTPPAGAPNIIVILDDDVGYGATSTFGGPIPTPNFSALAQNGLRYTEFGVTAICSSTRAALLTGRNHQHVGTGTVDDFETPYPGYDSHIPNSAATIAQILQANGYATSAFGKYHNVPNADQADGPYALWPTSMGFDYFYGFIGGDNDQFQPELYEDTTPVDGSNRPSTYILDNDLATHAITWLHQEQAASPNKPFFLYYATGSTHAPHQAPADWIARFKGQFDQGWDAQREATYENQKKLGILPASADLSPRPGGVPYWNSLTPDEKTVDERYMEVYAAELAYQDSQVGRILAEVNRMGLTSNTIVIWIEGDNGASGEGGPHGTINEITGFEHPDASDAQIDHYLAQHLDELGGPSTYELYPNGWAMALNSPYQWFKQIASHLGGTRDGMVISWPGHIIDPGSIRTQYHHVIDIAPTILDITHLKVPSAFNGIPQMPMDGVSLAYTFTNPTAPSTHRIQYFEMHGNRAIYDDGWLANTTPRYMPWELFNGRPNSDPGTYQWELYNLNEDPTQAHNLAAQYPDKLKQLQALFDQQAQANDVYPIQDGGVVERGKELAAFLHQPMRTHFVFWGTGVHLPAATIPPVFAFPFKVQADIEVPQGGADGVILAGGSLFSGWSFYLKDGVPTAYAAGNNYPGADTRVQGTTALTPGTHHLEYDLAVTKPGSGVLTILADGVQVAKQTVATLPALIGNGGETLDVGRDTGAPVSPDYTHEGVFTGTIDKVTLDISPPKNATATLFLSSQVQEKSE